MSMPAPLAAVSSPTSGRRRREGAAGQACATKAPKLAMLKWIDGFETGHAEIDALHRTLVKECNGLLTLLAEDGAWPLIVAGTRKLVVDCIEHFRVEDAILQRIGFPRQEAHAAQHRRVERELRDLVARMERVDGSLTEHRELPASLGPAIVDLMIRHDLDYRSHVLHRQGR
jgi:hemerythrin-like metal-binding protein